MTVIVVVCCYNKTIRHRKLDFSSNVNLRRFSDERLDRNGSIG